MKAILCSALLLLAAAGSITAHQDKAPQIIKKPVVKSRAVDSQVEVWLTQAGYKFKKASEGVWVIRVAGRQGESYQIIIASGPSYVIATVVIANRKYLKFDSDLAYRLLRLSHQLDFLKVAFDDDDDLFVGAEMRSKLLDADEFNAMLARLNAGAETTYTLVRPFLVR